MDSSNDRQRKDRLIQTRVPQNLESTLKDEARKRRLSVSHLIRNVLEDTFHLVDNVVTEVDRVVADSVGMAQTLRRDAQRLAATARGHVSHRTSSAYRAEAADSNEDERTEGDESEPFSDASAVETRSSAHEPGSEGPEPLGADGDADDTGLAEAILAVEAALADASVRPAAPPEPPSLPSTPALASMYGLQEMVVYRPDECAECRIALRRGTRAYLGLGESASTAQPVWLCVDCTDALQDG